MSISARQRCRNEGVSPNKASTLDEKVSKRTKGSPRTGPPKVVVVMSVVVMASSGTGNRSGELGGVETLILEVAPETRPRFSAGSHSFELGLTIKV
ncbi:hypothetical protein ACLB2K_063596 [Fragaria x ananassa]